MSAERVSARRLETLREQTSPRDVALVAQVAELKFMTTRQIEAVHFGSEAHASALAAARACRRCLERLTTDRLLVRLERRIGGIRAGSASFVYAIGPVGERLLGLPGPRRRAIEPSRTFLVHTLAVSQLVVDVTLAGRRGEVELLTLQTEPRCWRTSVGPGGSRIILKPDTFVSLGVGQYEHRWFVEVDLGSEHLPTLLRKCRAYNAYYRSGHEQAGHGVFPRVLWTMHTGERVERLREAIAEEVDLTTALFAVAGRDQALDVMRGGRS